MGRRQLALGKFGVRPTHWWREMDFELSVPGRKRVIAVGDGELTQDLLHRPPIERKLSDEQSSNRLDTMLADGKQRLPSAPCFALPLPMPLVGFAVRFGSGTGETFPRADRVMAAQCPLGDWYLLSKRRSRWPGRSAGCRPVPSNRARQKARQPASPRPRTRSSNPVPSSRESTNYRFLLLRRDYEGPTLRDQIWNPSTTLPADSVK